MSLRARALAAGLGGVGPMLPDHPNESVMLCLEVESTEALRGVTIDAIELLQSGVVVTCAERPVSVHRDLKAGSRFDTSRTEAELAPFDGDLLRGTTRLYASARLDRRSASRTFAAEVRLRAHVASADGADLWVEAPVETAYVTAGPAISR